MKKLKPIIGALGLLMMVAVTPTEQALSENLAKAATVWVLTFAAGVGMLAYAGAFKRPATK